MPKNKSEMPSFILLYVLLVKQFLSQLPNCPLIRWKLLVAGIQRPGGVHRYFVYENR